MFDGFWKVKEVPELKSAINIADVDIGMREKFHGCMNGYVVGASRASHTHPYPYQGSAQGFSSLKFSGTQGQVRWMTGIDFEGLVTGTGGMCYGFLYRFHFLKDTKEVESTQLLSSHVYPNWSVTWVDVRGGLRYTALLY